MAVHGSILNADGAEMQNIGAELRQAFRSASRICARFVFVCVSACVPVLGVPVLESSAVSNCWFEIAVQRR
jgi:hypothetical protein